MSDVPLEYHIYHDAKPGSGMQAVHVGTEALQVDRYGNWRQWDADKSSGLMATGNGIGRVPPPGQSYRLLNLSALTSETDPTGERGVAALALVLEAAGYPVAGNRVQCPNGEIGVVDYWQFGAGTEQGVSVVDEEGEWMDFFTLDEARSLAVIEEAE